jgi:TPR repeat protein
MYFHGYGVWKNNVNAVKWYRKAAEQGNAEGQYHLGTMYGYGFGIDQQEFGKVDHYEAAKRFHKAAKGGYIKAQVKLGELYAIGQGVKKDQAESVKWYYRAAVQGDAMAQISVGLAYFSGVGVPENRVLAYMWLYVAAWQMEGQIHETAVGVREYLKSNLSRKEISEARRFAQKWLSKEEVDDKFKTKI